MRGIAQTLLARALNATRQVYFPSYLGLRLIGQQLSEDDDGYIERLILRRLNASEKWRYKPFSLYKGSSLAQGRIEHEHRACIAPSAVTALAEASVLALMASDTAFAIPERVYSYRWPLSPYTGSSFEFFGEGYRRRNADISEALDEGKVVVVTDVKRFYPSVSFAKVQSALAERLLASAEPLRDNRENILAFFFELVEEGEGGIPIGPNAGHVLGHLAMEGVDSELTREFGGNYFRYVDDLIVVVPRGDATRARGLIRECLAKNGLEENEGKSASVSAEEWHMTMVRPDIDASDSFYRFARDLTVYLVFHSDRATSLKAAFASSGLAIPVQRLLALSGYSRFRYFFRKSRGILAAADLIRVWSADNDAFVRRALRLKHSYESEWRRASQVPRNAGLAIRRWEGQRIRRNVNALFYLRSFSEWASDLDRFELFPELLEQRALAQALIGGSANPILPFYLRGVGAFAELWAEYGAGYATFEWPHAGLTVPEVDSLILLQLCGVLRLSEMQLGLSGPRARLARIAAAERPERRTEPDLSFDDEFESLRLGVDGHTLANLARTRYSLREGTVLEALSLIGGGGGYYG